MRTGIPIKAMLANPAQSIEQVLKNFENQEITLEYKYDGERAQVEVNAFHSCVCTLDDINHCTARFT
jgi:ATP-dependent DNA ligase